jgi:fluoride ion exporter CrcB/FEX
VGGALGAMARFAMNVFLRRNELFYAFTHLFSTLVGGFACFYAGFAILRWLRATL